MKLRYRRASGQILPIFPFILIVLLVLVGLAIEIGVFWWQIGWANENARIGCIAASNSALTGGNAQTTFANVMSKNGVPTTAYNPKQGTGLTLKSGLELESDGSYRAALSWAEPTFLMNLVGVQEMPIIGKARCYSRNIGVDTPIAVKNPGALDGASHTILGTGKKGYKLADNGKGSSSFAGAVYIHLWCVLPSDTECTNERYFQPLTAVPPSNQKDKNDEADCMKGINCNIEVPVGTRLPIVYGTTAGKIVTDFENVHKVGDTILVFVFNDTVDGQGNSKSLVVTGYALFQITSMDSNSVDGKLVKGPYTSLSQIQTFLISSREISWSYTGALP